MVEQTNTEAPKACFVYGSLRPDDDSGQAWTKAACAGMTARKAIVKDVGLYSYNYAAAILGKPGKQVVGYVLTHNDDMVFTEKLQTYDMIEGYNAVNPEKGLYQRDAVEAVFLDENDKETEVKVRTWIYHRSGIPEDNEVPFGDWLKRDSNVKIY